MESRQASSIFEALSSDVRLDVFRLLVKNAPAGLVAGDIAKALDLPATNLSFHLKALVQSGLVSVEREGRFLRYRASIPSCWTSSPTSPRNVAPGTPNVAGNSARKAASMSVFCPNAREGIF